MSASVDSNREREVEAKRESRALRVHQNARTGGY